MLLPLGRGSSRPVEASKSSQLETRYQPRPPNEPLLRALWSLLDGIWGLLKGSWGLLEEILSDLMRDGAEESTDCSYHEGMVEQQRGTFNDSGPLTCQGHFQQVRRGETFSQANKRCVGRSTMGHAKLIYKVPIWRLGTFKLWNLDQLARVQFMGSGACVISSLQTVCCSSQRKLVCR